MVFNNPYEVLSKILFIIDIPVNQKILNEKIKIDNINLYKLEEKIKKREKYNKYLNDINEIKKNRIKLILESNIDIRKFGNKAKISRLTGIRTQHLKKMDMF